MPLHRLAHFLDMILPQLSPMHTRWDDPRKTLLCCHFFRLERAGTSAKVRLQFLFTSRALIYMVRIGWERQPLLLFSDVHRIGLESFQHFQTPTNGTVNKHNVQMGLSEGHSVLLHFSQNGFAYQAVLVSMSSAPSRGKRGEHAMWKHAQPLSTDFAWLPEDVAQAFCSLALRQDQTRQYGSFNEIQLGFNEHYQAWLHIQGLYYLGETRSVEEFGIFSQMPAERLCLGCGVQSDETFGLLPPQDRGKLFEATVRLMRLMLVDEPMDVIDDEEQLRRALMPLVHNRDGHFLATLSALLLSFKTDCPISGVFGAGKTRAAAAIISGLITVDPSLKIMILTKENVASQAFAEHIIGLSLPTWIERKFGRLVGFMALHKIRPQAVPDLMSPQPIAVMYFAPNKSSLDAVAGFAMSVRASTVRLPSGCPKLTWLYKMRVNSMGIWTKQQPLPVYRAIAWCFGLVTIVKLRAVSENPLRPGDSDKSCCGDL